MLPKPGFLVVVVVWTQRVLESPRSPNPKVGLPSLRSEERRVGKKKKEKGKRKDKSVGNETQRNLVQEKDKKIGKTYSSKRFFIFILF